MQEIKNTQIGLPHICLEDSHVLLEIFDFSQLPKGQPILLVKSKVHFLFCMGAPVNFQFSPAYGRVLDKEKAFIIYNPDTDLNSILDAAEPGVLIRLSIKLQRLHQLFAPEVHTAPIFNPSNTHLKSYEEIEIIPELLIVLNNLIQKSRQPDSNPLFYQAKVLEIFSLIYAEKPQQTNQCPFLKNEAIVRKIKEAKELLISQYKKPPTIPELARAVQLNQFQLKVGFKEIYGSGPYHFLMTHKLEIAKQLLISGEHHVQEVAHQIGYSNTSHFISAFKKHFGVTPKKLIGR
jgi:AraC-like DNA-binding protein